MKSLIRNRGPCRKALLQVSITAGWINAAWDEMFASYYLHKDEDAFIGPKEFVSHMMMTQTKDKLFHHWIT